METDRKLIKEKVLLSACQVGDTLRISYYEMGYRVWLSSAELRKIKPIGKGKVQIKYLGSFGDTVQKMDLPGNIEVERTRLWVEADGEDAGYYERKRVIVTPSEPVVTKQQAAADHIAKQIGNVMEEINPGLGTFMSSIFNDLIGRHSYAENVFLHPGMGKALDFRSSNTFPLVTMGADVSSVDDVAVFGSSGHDTTLVKPSYGTYVPEGQLPNLEFDKAMLEMSVNDLIKSWAEEQTSDPDDKPSKSGGGIMHGITNT